MTSAEHADHGPSRVVVENPTPRVDGGRVAVKRIVGDELVIEADVFADGHDELDVRLRWCREGDGAAGDGAAGDGAAGDGAAGDVDAVANAARTWHETAMEPLGNDRWRASFALAAVGRYRYTVVGWIDRIGTWQQGLRKKVEAGQDVSVDLLIGADLVQAAANRAAASVAGSTPAAVAPPPGSTSVDDAARLTAWAAALRDEARRPTPPAASHTATGRPHRTSPAAVTGRPHGPSPATSADLPPPAGVGLDPELLAVARRHADRSGAASWEPAMEVIVDRERARFSAWYELFPRSASPDPSRHGTFRDVIERLPYVTGMGFDVLYLPPVHPIGLAFRKGPNNVVGADPDDPGVPWAIGSPDGGHTAIHPALGTLADFRALVAATTAAGAEIALDIAFQASPDHPWVSEHPEWFRHRPDGSVQYAENPPKKYQDIYPFDFETPAWRELWAALEGVFRFWIDQGVAIFRVDNPHTKPFAFWEWVIDRIRRDRPDVLFLAEAFTRPRVMQRLAKVGFTQSYTYFTWRNTKAELIEYFTELTTQPLSEFFRPNAWPNTPDILHEVLQVGGRPMFEARLVLAATLSADYGIYGPAYELAEAVPIERGSEEYLNSEKYQQRTWDPDREDSLRPLITAVNRARRSHPALQRNDGLRFHPVDNDQLIAYTKRSPDGLDLVLVVVNLDPRRVQSGTVELPLDALGLDANVPIEVSDELNGDRYLWQGPRNPVELRPGRKQAHVFAVRQSRRSEQQFETYR